jgi:hypothetical protein
MGSHHKTHDLPEGLHVIAYGAMVDVSRELVAYVASLLAARRRARGTRRRSRALSCGKQALFALVWFRKREDLTVLAAGFGISRATGYRYRDEAVAVLAVEAPELSDALRRAQQEGCSHVILDGKIVDTDRCGEKTISRKGEVIDVWYSGKRHDFGGNIQAVMRPDGLPIWVGTRPDMRAGARPRRTVRRSRPRPAHPGRPRLQRRRHWDPCPVQAAHRRAPARRGQTHLHQVAPRDAGPRRTRLRPAGGPLARPAAHHRQSQPHRRYRESPPRAHPFRARISTSGSG